MIVKIQRVNKIQNLLFILLSPSSVSVPHDAVGDNSQTICTVIHSNYSHFIKPQTPIPTKTPIP